MAITGAITSRKGIYGGLSGGSMQGGVTIGHLFYSNVLFGTKADWNSQITLIGAENTVYVYTDYKQDEEGKNIPGLKVGDGLGYLIDAPFVDAQMQEHMANTIIHITAEERDFWNNKVSVYIDSEDSEHAVFTTD